MQTRQLLMRACVYMLILLMAAPPEISSVIHAGQPYGAGKYAVLFITAYDTELWTDAAQWSMNAPFALTLRYHIGFSSSYLINRTLREMKGVAGHVGRVHVSERQPAYDVDEAGDRR